MLDLIIEIMGSKVKQHDILKSGVGLLYFDILAFVQIAVVLNSFFSA
jgi:hypothetical protein